MSMTAKQGVTRTKLEIYCNRKTSNWRNKEDNHLKIKKHGGLLTQVGYVEIRQQYTFGKRELLPIFIVCIQNWRDGVNFLYFFHFFVNISLLSLHIIQRFAAFLLKEVNLKKWRQCIFFFPHLNVQLVHQYLKKKGLNNLAFNCFYYH